MSQLGLAPSGFAEIQNMLIAGGYFRARLSGLTEFDVVAGGLSWGVRNSRFSIDVEFVEDATIRHKIKIAENICQALKEQMKCPHDLAPHQIQGLHYPSIVVVLRWLIKKIAVAREENAYFTRQHAKLLFERKFGHALFSNVPLSTSPQPRDELKSNTHSEPAPQLQLRRFRFHGDAPVRVMITKGPLPVFASPTEHVASILLEYGDRYVVTETPTTTDVQAVGKEDRDLDAEELAERRERAAQLEQEEREKAMLDRLAVTMSAHHGKEKLTSASLGSVLANADSSKLQRLRAQYEERRSVLEEQLAADALARGRIEGRKARLQELEEECETLKAKWKKSLSTQKKAQALALEVEASLHDEEAAVATLEAEVIAAESEARKDPVVAAALDSIMTKRREIQTLEESNSQEAERQNQELEELKTEVIALQEQVEEAEHVGGGTAEFDRLSQVKAELDGQLHELSMLNLDLQRCIDSYPTRLELEQYNLRVNELDEEIAWKFEETKMSYFRYNTQVEVRRCADNELEVFSVVRKQYEHCAATVATAKEGKQARNDFLEDVERFVAQLSTAAASQRTRLNEEEKILHDKADECTNLVHRQQEITTRLDAMRRALEQQAELRAQLREFEAAQE